MFRRSSLRYGHTPAPETSYQKAAQIWDERIGTARVQAQNWRLMALGNLTLSLIMTGLVLWQSARGSVTPWIVEIDGRGEAQAVAPALSNYKPSDPQIAWHLARFIEEVRSIPVDPIVLRDQWLRAYDFTSDQGAAALNDYARVNDPFVQLGHLQIAVEISSVIRASDDSFRIAWTERRYEDGHLAATERWAAILTLVIDPPRNADRLRRNPLGIYITAFNWSKELGP